MSQKRCQRLKLYHVGRAWQTPPRERVALRFLETSPHYALGAHGWSYLLPPTGHIVHAENGDGVIKVHTVALFHQLRCLDIIQKAYVEEGRHRTDPMVASCMNYLRQSLLCRMDIRNEPQGSVPTSNGFDSLCYNWEGIYKEAIRNQALFGK